MNKLYTIIGRFQYPHNGHVKMIRNTLDKCGKDDNVLILIGSSNRVRELDNPMTFEERSDIITEIFKDDISEGKLYIAPLADYDYDDGDKIWTENLHSVIRQVGDYVTQGGYYEPVFVCSSKDNDSELRKDWSRGCKVMAVEPVKSGSAFSGTMLRRSVERWGVSAIFLNDWFAPKETRNAIVNNDELLDFVKKESKAVEDYKKSWDGAPFTPTFHATDAVVRDSNGDFLLIRRGGSIGKGTIALAGGFLEPELTHEENMKKELLEEAGIDLDSVEHEIVTSWFCDSPKRAVRGRMTTLAFLVQLPEPFENYSPVAGDDANKIVILSSDEVNSEKLFNDHKGLIVKLLELEARGVPYVKNY